MSGSVRGAGDGGGKAGTGVGGVMLAGWKPALPAVSDAFATY